jgi:hypothetical protein
MPIQLGNTNITKAYLGSTEVTKAYLGNVLVFGGVVQPLLLDAYPNASGAYSLRYLNSAYSGAVIRVIKSTGFIQEQDFTPTEIIDGTLLAWVADGSDQRGYVKTIYDQSGNGNDIIAEGFSVVGKMAVIAEFGSLIINNGLPAMFFSNTQHYESTDNINTNQLSMCSVFNNTTITGGDRIFGVETPASTSEAFWQAADNTIRNDGTFQAGTITPIIGDKIRYSGRDGNQMYDYINDDENINIVKILGNTNGTIAFSKDTQFFDGYFQEAVLWETDEIANRTGIQDNLNAYYSIY